MMDLQEISDRLELQRLTHLYCDAIDSGNFDGLDDVFTSDSQLDYVDAGGIKGSLPEVKAWLRKALAMFGPAHHFVTNQLFEIDGDTATGKSMCWNPMGWPLATPDQDTRSVMFFAVWYFDRYVRTSDGWRITDRREQPSLHYNLPDRGMPDWSGEQA